MPVPHQYQMPAPTTSTGPALADQCRTSLSSPTYASTGIIVLTVCNEGYSIYPGQDEAQRTKLLKNNYAAIPNILQKQNIKETRGHRSDSDAVTTTEAPPVRMKRVGRGGGAHYLCSFLVALACKNDSSHFSLLLLRNNTFFPILWKKSA